MLRNSSLWDEALLTATLWFITRHLSIRSIFFHTAQTQQALKQFGCMNPPQSLYTKLPRKFGFAETSALPQMLKREKRLKKLLRKEKPRFYWREMVA